MGLPAAAIAQRPGMLRRNPVIATLAVAGTLSVSALAYLASLKRWGQAGAKIEDAASQAMNLLQATHDASGKSVWEGLVQAYEDGGVVALHAAEDKLSAETWEQLKNLQVPGPSATDDTGDELAQGSTDTSELMHSVDADPLGTDTLALGVLKDWVAIVVQAMNADPCEDFNGFANGDWLMEHPASSKVPVTAWGQRLARVPDQVVALMQRNSSSLSGGAKAIADVYASAMKVDSAQEGLASLRSELNAIAGLKDESAVGRYICDHIGSGMGSILGVDAFFGVGVLDAHVTASKSPAFYQQGADSEACKAYIDEIAANLVKTGMAQSTAADRAKNVFDIEARLVPAARGATTIEEVDRDEAAKLVPGFPWSHLWDHAFALTPEQKLYVPTEFCSAIVTALDDFNTVSWQAFLTSQLSRRAFPYMGAEYSERAITPRSVYEALDDRDVGQGAISDAYLEWAKPQWGERAQNMFSAVKGQYQRDISASSFSDGDKKVMSEAIDAAQFQWENNPSGGQWSVTSSDASYLANLLAMRKASVGARIDAIRAGTVSFMPPMNAHEDAVGVFAGTGEVRVSPASLQGLPTDREGQWATWGFIFGHEVAHLIQHSGAALSAQGQALLHKENEAIKQRYEGAELGQFKLNATLTLEENSSDLRGLSVAHRLGVKQAEEAGQPFDHAGFFNAYARMAAANPTRPQIEKMLKEHHAPQSVRVDAAKHIKGFDRAFDCPPGPRLPVDGTFGGATASGPRSESGSALDKVS